MENPIEFTDKNLVAMMRKDSRRQAEAAENKLGEVIDHLSSENHLAALGAFVGLEDDIAVLKVFLVRMVQLVPYQTPNASS